jgi:hypothetical protein
MKTKYRQGDVGFNVCLVSFDPLVISKTFVLPKPRYVQNNLFARRSICTGSLGTTNHLAKYGATLLM